MKERDVSKNMKGLWHDFVALTAGVPNLDLMSKEHFLWPAFWQA